MQSEYNVLVPLKGRGQGYFALFNTLAGSIDVIDGELAADLPGADRGTRSTTDGGEARGTFVGLPRRRPLSSAAEPVISYLDRRGYLFSSRADEQRVSRVLYNTMVDFHRKAVAQPLVVIPSYNCDLKCPYCWQRLYHMDSPIMTAETAERLVAVLPQFVDARSPGTVDFTVFGGEPLQDVPALRERVLQLLDLAAGLGYATKVISNGVGLKPAVPFLAGKVDLIQITIDGPADVHKRRRPLPLKLGGDSFQPMVEGIDLALKNGIRINVRVNVDESNLPRLPELTDFAAARGWLDTELLKMHLAPVKNHNPKRESNSESGLLLQVLELVESDERMAVYDLTGFPGIKYFQGFRETGLFSLHRFFNCEAQINFWAFDLHGDVYACWDAAGQDHLAVGRFLPEVVVHEEKLSQWRDRTSLDIDGCQGCSSSAHCGGGCQFLALEHNNSFEASSCDSMMTGYVDSIERNSDWLMERAISGDHAVGMATLREVVTAVNRPFGLLDERPVSLPISCG
ncbi:uncharacterized protein HD597_005245 [Nonomuraea thailandensis]|uniref:Radical SAM core domain-containing protein n=1 Tax=Nonomuraea thailandensis TaxID=1188745 RepID=A0A9X2K3K0_9ACTN|nr:radical SAM protein [Nonomuraea thailandensis]MCP2358225.1 uncharacterized protein [Nonomuraea thailandensis]